jgi:16S rRNA (guanine527-N7)-methyltransferase
MTSSLSQALAELLNLGLSSAQLAAFETYSAELREWNARVNLTAITDPHEIDIRHFADSLTCLRVIAPRNGLRVIDVGSGAGFPGLPLKIVCPTLALTLVEATAKKAAFLEHMINVLRLDGVTLLNIRAEEAGQMPDQRERYDWVLARAVAGMAVLAEYLLPLAKIGGRCLALKGESAHQEAAEAEHAIRLLGGRLAQITAVELPSVAETHYLVEIEKIAATPAQYPRRAGAPSKKPL